MAGKVNLEDGKKLVGQKEMAEMVRSPLHFITILEVEVVVT